MSSPYDGFSQSQWRSITEKLVSKHPLTPELADAVLAAWEDIFASRVGSKQYRIGRDIQLVPQLMGSLLHELIPLVVSDRHPNKWRRQRTKNEKDLVCLFDPTLSLEIKTSSHPSQVFGNRSYGQKAAAEDPTAKGKSGYYLAVNFEKFDSSGRKPKITLVRFGWFDRTDWISQHAQTGQQARLPPATYELKLVRLYPLDTESSASE